MSANRDLRIWFIGLSRLVSFLRVLLFKKLSECWLSYELTVGCNISRKRWWSRNRGPIGCICHLYSRPTRIYGLKNVFMVTGVTGFLVVVLYFDGGDTFCVPPAGTLVKFNRYMAGPSAVVTFKAMLTE